MEYQSNKVVLNVWFANKSRERAKTTLKEYFEIIVHGAIGEHHFDEIASNKTKVCLKCASFDAKRVFRYSLCYDNSHYNFSIVAMKTRSNEISHESITTLLSDKTKTLIN